MIEKELSSASNIRKYISLQEASKFCKYSQEYLSLRARQGKLKSVKFGRNWVTTKEWLEEYLQYNGNGEVVAQLARVISPPENLPVERDEFEISEIPQNFGGFRKSTHPLKILRFFRAISLKPLVPRDAFIFSLVFILIIAGGVFGKENLRNTYEDLSPVVEKISNKKISVSDNLVSVGEIAQSSFNIFKEYGSWTARQIENSKAGRVVRDDLEIFADYSSWAGRSISRIYERSYQFSANLLNKPYKLFSSVWRKILPGRELFIGKEDFEALKADLEQLKKEPFIVKRVEVEKVVEPVKEITREIEYTKQITKIDDASLEQIRDDIAYLQKDVQNRLYAPGGVISQTIYVKEPIQSPKIYQENGEIVLQTRGSGNVILSAATGLQLYGKQVVIESTSILNPLVYIASPLRIGGAFTATGAATIGGSISAQTITLNAPSSYSGDLVQVSHGDTQRFTIANSGAASLVGNFTVSGISNISVSSASAALTIAQSGTGKIFDFSSTGSGVTADLGTITGTTQGAVLAIAQYGTGLVLDASGAVKFSEAALSAASKVMDDLLFAANFDKRSLVGTRGQLPTYTDSDNTPTFETIDDAAQIAPAGNALKFTYQGETLYYPTSGNIGAATGTISFWYSPDYGYSTTVDKYLFETANNLRILYDSSAQKFVAQAYDGTDWTTSTATSSAQTFSADNWIHIAVAYAASSSTAPLTLYINNSRATSTNTWTAQALPTNFYIGSDSSGANRAHGLIADFNIFDRALSRQEIQQIYYLKRNLQDYAQYVLGKSIIYEKTPETALAISQYGTGSIITATSSVDTTSVAVKFTNLGTGNTLLIEDSDADSSPFYIGPTGLVGIGTTNASTSLHVVTTTDQLRLGYDSGNYINFNVASDGALDLMATGTDADIEIRTKNFDNAFFIDDSTGRIGIGTTTPSAYFTIGTTTEFLVVDPNSAKVGIGTTTPSAKLAVSGGIYGTGQVILTYAPQTGGAGNITDSSLYINPTGSVADANLLGIADAGTWKFRVDKEGDVFLQGNLTTAGSVTEGTTTIANLIVEGYSHLGDSANNDYVNILGTTTISANNANPALTVTQTGSGYGGIITGGSVGIGTTTPRYLLDVWGDIAFGTSTATSSTAIVPAFFVDTGDGPKIGIGTTTLYGLLTVGTTTPTLIVDPASNVGIATTTPSTRFAVAGNIMGSGNIILYGSATSTYAGGIQATAVKLTQNPTANYVLTSDVNGYGSWQSLATLQPNTWQFIGPNAIRPTTTVGIIVSASSTFAGDLTINSDSYTSASLFVDASDGRVGIGTTTLAGLLTVGTTTPSLVVAPNGRVGIRTTSPSSLLDITQTAIAETQADAYGFSLVNTTAAAPGSDLATGGTASASGAIDPAASAFDDNAATHWNVSISGSNYPQWLKYDFGVGLEKVVIRYTLQASSDCGTCSPQDWTFSGSNNDSTWTTLDTQTGITFSNGETKTYNFGNTTAYRYYRINVTLNGGHASSLRIAEMELMASTQQYSPPLRWRGYGWKTDATAGSQSVDFRTFVRPIQGAAAPTGGLDFQSSINEAAYSNLLTILSGGNIGIGNTAPSSKLTVNGGDFTISSAGSATTTISSATSTFAGPISGGGSQFIIATTTGSVLLQPYGGNVGIGTTTLAGLLTVGTTTPALVVSPVSYVGIGTSTPSTNFAVAGNIMGSGNMVLYGTATSTMTGPLEIASPLRTAGNIYPNADNTYTLGSALARWSNIYAATTTIGDTIVIGTNVIRSSNDSITLHASQNLTASTTQSLILASGGSEAARFDTAGNLGIATTTPRYKLDVWGDIAFGTSTATSSTAIVPAFFVDTGDGPKIGIGTTTLAGLLTVGTTTPALVVDPRGYVGIGTATPSSKLHVEAGAVSALIKGNNGSALLNIDSATVSNAGAIQFLTAGSSKWYLGSHVNIAAEDIEFAESVNTRMIVKSGGNVGIATTTPRYKLDVWGDMAVGTSTDSNTPMLYVDSGTGGAIGIGTSTVSSNFLTIGTTTEYLVIDRQGNVGIATSTLSTTYKLSVNGQFYTSATTTIADGLVVGVSDLYVSSNGNVGIGTASPEAKLQIAGLVYQSGLGNSTYFGYEAGKVDDLSDNDNVGIGYRALDANTTGNSNVAVGISALGANIVGTYNTAIGYQSLTVNTANYNTAIGYQALTANTSGRENVAVGPFTLDSNIGGIYNTGVGMGALDANTSGNNNQAFGYQAGNNITTGSNNLIIGYDVDAPLAAGSYQLSIGNLIFGTNVDGTGTTISSGNVGIATTTPRSKLDVWGNITIGTSSAGKYGDSNGTTTPALYVLSGNGGQVGIGTTTLGTALLTVGTTTPSLVVANNGYVGIGTSSPSQKLHVSGQIGLDNVNEDKILFLNSTNRAKITYSTGDFLDFYAGNDTSANGVFRFFTGDSTPGFSEKVRITNIGNLGIATTTPRYLLDVWGDIAFGTSTAISSTAIVPAFFVDTGDGPKIGIGTTTLYGLLTVGTTTPTLIVDPASNVGIATTTPSTRFAVAGNIMGSGNIILYGSATSTYAGGIQATAVKLTQNPTANYVLTSDVNGYGSWQSLATLQPNTWQFIGPNAIRPTTTVGIIVSASSTFAGDLTINSDSYTSASLFVDASDGRIGIGTTTLSGLLTVGTTTPSLVVAPNGNVGIGMTSPAAALQVRGSASSQGTSIGQIIINSIEAYNASPQAGLFFENKYIAAGDYAGMGGLRVSKLNTTDGDYSSFMAFDIRNNGSTQSEAMRIDNLGRVGIGTTTPRYTLDVWGDIAFGTSTAISSTAIVPAFFVDTGDGPKIGIGTTTLGTALLTVGTTTPSLVVANNGYVGIGTAGPEAKLQVAGGNTIIGGYNQGTDYGTFFTPKDNGAWSWIAHMGDVNGLQIGSGSVIGTTPYITMLDGGSVGIGTAGPSELLTVFSATDPTFQIGTGSATTTISGLTTATSTIISGLSVGNNAALVVNQAATANSLYIAANGNVGIGTTTLAGLLTVGTTTPSLVVAPNGNVGIGTTTPANKLQVASGHIGVDSTYGLVTTDSSWTGFAAGTINSAEGTYIEGFGITFSGDAAGQIRIKAGTVTDPSGNQGNILFYTSSNVEQMRIDRAGYIGIGDTSPDFGLEIGASSTDGYFAISGGTGGSGNGDKFLVDENGNVGIATTSPRYKLDVWGDIAFGTSTDTNTPALYVDSGNGGRIGIGTTTLAGLLTVGTTTPALVVSPVSYVGIGTSTPSTNFAVAGNIIGSGNMVIYGTTATSTFTGGLSAGNNAALVVNQAATANSLYINPSGNIGIGTASPDMKLTVNGDMNIANNNGMVIGHTAQLTVSRYDGGASLTSEVQILGTASDDASILIGQFSADALPPHLIFQKSRNATIGSNTALQSGDVLGVISAQGADGGGYIDSNSSEILFAIDGDTGTNDMPGRIVFRTSPDGSALAAERMRINSSGNVGIGTTGPSELLTVFSATDPTFQIGTGSATTTISGLTTATSTIISGLSVGNNAALVVNQAATANSLYIAANGNIGIATTSPRYKLDVWGDFAVGTTTDTNTPILYVDTGTGGKIGIGTTTPSAMLTINESGDFAFGSFNASTVDTMEGSHLDWHTNDARYVSTSTETSIVKTGGQSLKIYASTTPEDIVVRKIYTTAENYSNQFERLGFWIYADKIATSSATTTQIISVGIYSSANPGTATSTKKIYIQSEDKWQYEEWTIGGLANATSVNELFFRIDVNNIGTFNFYIDQIRLYDNTERSAEMFVGKDGNLVVMGRGGVEIGRADGSGNKPGLKVDTAVVEINQPLSVNVGGDVGMDNDLQFLSTGLSQITSEGPLRITAGDSNHSENLTLTTGGTGDVIVELNASSSAFIVTHSWAASTTVPFIINSESNSTTTAEMDKLGILFQVISDYSSDENTVFSIDASGNYYYDRSAHTPAADVAENYFVEDQTIEAGDVVCLSESTSLKVEKCSQFYQSNLIGVISSRPALVMAADLLSSRPVALNGRVPVKVSLENGPINIGDPLTSASSSPGLAMKADRAGKIFGYALENYNPLGAPLSGAQGAPLSGATSTETNSYHSDTDSEHSDYILAFMHLDELGGDLTVTQNEQGNLIVSAYTPNGQTQLFTIDETGALVVGKLKTQELCVGSVCVTETDFMRVFGAGVGSVITTTSTSEVNATTTSEVNVVPELPDSVIDSGPGATTTATEATFTFHSTKSDSVFSCQLDGDMWQGCESPKTYTGLPIGLHQFSVMAMEPSGEAEPSPSIYVWEIIAEVITPGVDGGTPGVGATSTDQTATSTTP